MVVCVQDELLIRRYMSNPDEFRRLADHCSLAIRRAPRCGIEAEDAIADSMEALSLLEALYALVKDQVDRCAAEFVGQGLVEED